MLRKCNSPLIFSIKTIVTTSSTFGNKYANRERKMMNKIMHGREKGKKTWYTETEESPKLPSADSLSKSKGQGKEASRRINVLNKLFMKNISDLLASGEHSEDISGKGLEISRVKVAPDFQQVNVYWLASGTDTDDELEDILKKVAISIRYQLSQLRIMGEVPKLSFHKDKHFAKSAEVDNILHKADFGPDHIPDLGYIRKEFVNEEELLSNNIEALPEMRHDVFGLNQSRIIEKIRRNLRKSKDAWQNYENSSTQLVDKTNVEDNKLQQITENIETMKTSDFTKFLERKLYKKSTPERKQYKYEKELIPKEVDASILNHKEKDDFIVDEDIPDKKT